MSSNKATPGGGGGVARHVDLIDLPSGTGDPHTQYFYNPGRAGGQTAIGGTLTTQLLTLQDNVADVNQITWGPGLSGGVFDAQTDSGDGQWRHLGLGVSRAPTNTHMIIGAEVFTTPGVTVVGAGYFPDFRPSSSVAGSNVVGLQGNAWFATANWPAGSTVRCLDFFPAPQFLAGPPFGSATLNMSGVNTGGMLNILGQTVTANTITALSVIGITNLFGGTDNTTANVVRGMFVQSPTTTLGTWARLTAIEVEPQTSGVVNHGIWLKGDGAGSCLCLGAGLTVNPDARIYYDGTNVIIDPDVTGSGIVLIGATGDDDMRLTNIEIDGDLNHDGSNVGFYNVAPVARPAAYTQTYSTTTRTHANLTSSTLTDSTTGTANTTVVAMPAVGGSGATAAQESAINDNFADLVAQVNALRADLENVKQLLNSVIDDDQSQGLKQ